MVCEVCKLSEQVSKPIIHASMAGEASISTIGSIDKEDYERTLENLSYSKTNVVFLNKLCPTCKSAVAATLVGNYFVYLCQVCHKHVVPIEKTK